MSKRNKHSQQRQSVKPRYQVSQASNALVDIVIPVYGRFDLLKECLDALPEAAIEIPYHVILVDNNSPKEENPVEFYKSLSIKHSLIVNKDNVGFPKACNQGAAKGRSPLVFFLNSDVVLHHGSLSRLVKMMDDPEVGVCGMKLIFSPLPTFDPVRPSNTVQHVGLATDIRGDFYHLFVGWSPDHPKVNAVKEVIAVTGAALMVRRGLYQKVGGFDEVFGMGTYEDVDLCLKVLALGSKVMVDTGASGYHYTNATAVKYGIEYPINMNSMLLKSRWAGKYPWTSYLHH